MAAARRAREAIAGLSPQAREMHGLAVLQLELLADLVDQVGELVRQGRGDATTTGTTTTTATPAGTRTGAGRPAVGDQVADQDQDGGDAVKVRTVEPELPADVVDQDDDDGKPAPARKPAKKATKAAAGRSSAKE